MPGRNPMDGRPSAEDLAYAIQSTELTEPELRYLQAMVEAKLGLYRKQLAARLRPGIRVGFGDRGAVGRNAWRVGRLVRVARTRVRIDCDGILWNVPLSMVEVLEDAAQE
jgi:hypothetical protein